jgi:hypothetical protein
MKYLIWGYFWALSYYRVIQFSVDLILISQKLSNFKIFLCSKGLKFNLRWHLFFNNSQSFCLFNKLKMGLKKFHLLFFKPPKNCLRKQNSRKLSYKSEKIYNLQKIINWQCQWYSSKSDTYLGVGSPKS